MASTQLNKAVQKNTGNDNITKMTFSAWIKRSALGEGIIFAAHQLSTYYTHFYFNSDDRIQIYSYINASTAANLVLERLFRDTNAWYHIVLTIDTTLNTDSDRMKVYVNGERETITNGGTTYPSQSSSFGQFSDTGATLNIGDTANRGAFSGSMSHINYTPYTAYDASAFGETDATTGEWKIKTSPTVTYSTAGFFILKDGNSVTDQSGNSNNFTVGAGTLTNTEDCPSDVFATLNPLVPDTDMTFAHGNTTQQRTSGTWDYSVSTLGADKGKYYFEGKIYGTGHWILGATDEIDGIAELGNGSGDFGYRNSGGVKSLGVDEGNPYSTYTSSDVISIAMDLDNRKIYSAKNGVWENSGDPTSGATGTGAYDLLATSTYFFGACCYITSGTSGWYCNFGNGYFGTTAISSEGTNASGIGKFEYDVPTGYTALSTKGLNS
jgi:hypothetical protein